MIKACYSTIKACYSTIKAVPQFRNDQNITLRGSLIGDVSGTQAPERMVQTGGGNMFSGICGVLDMIGGTSTSASNIGVD